jgi:hypothetical protein
VSRRGYLARTHARYQAAQQANQPGVPAVPTSQGGVIGRQNYEEKYENVPHCPVFFLWGNGGSRGICGLQN